MGASVRTANLGRWFPPWTVSRATWHATLRMNVSGVSTDEMRFRENGARLFHHYRVIGEFTSHILLRGTYMSKLRHFSSRACADARSVAKRDRDPDATLDETLGRPGHPPSPTVETGRRVTDDDPPARKAVRAISYVVDGESSPAAIVSTARYIVPLTPLLLPLRRFTGGRVVCTGV